ncbi:uncharacterized protein F4807DRAFT_452527 [Annulohypoxylon truncatum]|uniref:uncharacterized protein n=1 Tax=Annulohypoxylon truncatum TaxID=327061 RepID=UPI0020084BEE|nr:uncharacterized protein F4807DRAFT_452527 [Annulohypoxylon truncatum]KAI1207969.1 hypothetical protein F4807DRAFT_452527 [Annulohypoxylon truncatum]
MVGIPKSNRCDFCRRRKTKCDENWPICGTCSKAGKKCSGPSKHVKFVYNGKHTRRSTQWGDISQEETDAYSTDELSVPALSTTAKTSLLNLRNKTMASGAIFSKLRIYTRKPQIPKKLPGTRFDLLGGKVVMYLKSSEGTGYSLSTWLSTLGYVPPLLEGNEALFDATNLLLSTWIKLCQGADRNELFDLSSYNRALQSLQKVLNDTHEQTSNATLAATIYLQTTEYIFDYAGSVNQISHSNGIYSILMQRGPPKHGDHLGAQLMLDAFAYMFSLVIAGKIENFYAYPAWAQVIMNFFDQWKTRTPWVVEVAKLLIQAMNLADTINRFTKIWDAPSYLRDEQEIEDLSAVVDDLSTHFRGFDESTIEPLLQRNLIYEVSDTESPLGTRYEFPNGTTALHFANVNSFNIVINRMRQELNKMRGFDDSTIEAECFEWSSRIWRTCQYGLSLRPLCAVTFNDPVRVSYLAGGEAEREYLLKFLREANKFRKQPTNEWVEESIGSHAWLLMGQ